MEKFFKIFSAAAFSVAILGFIGLGIYLYLEKGEKTSVAVVSDKPSEVDPTAPVVVVGDITKEAKPQQQTLEEYAIKKVKTEISVEQILFYLLGLVVAFYLLKKLLQFWRYLVKHSV